MSRHRRTLETIFETPTPTPADVRWAAIEGLVRHLGGEVVERAGSRVLLVLNERKMHFHRPHPRLETGRATVRQVREFLRSAGVEP